MSTQLIKYEAACRALAECKAVDEVKAWADKAAAMQAYGRMAKDKSLEVDAAEIRIRAERRLGEMLAAQKADGGLNRGTVLAGSYGGASRGESAVVSDDRRLHTPTLASAGISKDLSSRAQKLAAIPEQEFEETLGEWRDNVKAEGARVTAKLVQAGERALQEQESECFGPSEEEIAQAQADADADNARLIEIINADDPLADALKEVARLKAQLAVTELQRDGYMNQCAQARNMLKRAHNQIARLQKMQNVVEAA